MQVLLDDYDVASVATDLVNTAPEVAVSTGDGLADPHALHRFLHERRVAPDALAGGRSPTPAELAAVHRLRAEVRAIIDCANRCGMWSWTRPCLPR